MMPRVLTANDADLNTYRTRRTASWATAVSLLAMLVGTCIGCQKGQSPVQPTPVPPNSVTSSLRGSVHDTVLKPLADVRIEVVDGAGADVVATTDPSGAFSLSGTFSNTVTVQAVKDGYKTYLTQYAITQRGTYLNITLDLDAPSVDMTGDYTLTVTSATSCAGLPDTAHVRTYDLSIVPDPIPAAPDQYTGVLSGATFPSVPSAMSTNRLHVGVAGTVARVDFGDLQDDGTAVVEEIAPSTYLAIWGSAFLTVGGPAISGSFEGAIEYCASSTLPFARGFYTCPVQPIDCLSTHAIVLTRR